MKNFLKENFEIFGFLIIWMIFFFCAISCVEQSPEEVKEMHSEMYQKKAEVIELTFPDEEGVPRTHEYVVLAWSEYRNGLDHYIHCKYCKKY